VIRKYKYFSMISVINLIMLLLNGESFCWSLQGKLEIVGNWMKYRMLHFSEIM